MSAITAEAMEFLRSRIGEQYPLRGWNSTVTRDAIWHFAQGMGDDSPLYWDPEYPANRVRGRMIAPPTFLYSCSSGGNRPWDEQRYGLPTFLPGVVNLWLGDRWVWHQPVLEGMRVEATVELFDVEDREGSRGRTVTQTHRIRYFDADTATLLAEAYQVMRRVEAPAAAEATGTAVPDYAPPSYSEEEIAAIGRHYEAELERRRGADPRRFEDVRVGEELPPLVKGPLTITNIVGWVMGWGSPLCPTNRIAKRLLDQDPGSGILNRRTGITDTLEGPHWDPVLARQFGMQDSYDFGAQRISWAAHLLTDWCGDEGDLVEMEMRLRRPNLLGDTTWMRGTVVGRREDSRLVECEVRGVNQDDVTTIEGTALVRLP